MCFNIYTYFSSFIYFSIIAKLSHIPLTDSLLFTGIFCAGLKMHGESVQHINMHILHSIKI